MHLFKSYLYLSVFMWSYFINHTKAKCSYEKSVDGVQLWTTPCFEIKATKAKDGIEVTTSCKIDPACSAMRQCKNQSYDLFDYLRIPKPVDLKKFMEIQTDSMRSIIQDEGTTLQQGREIAININSLNHHL